jgi:hypothetical protein
VTIKCPVPIVTGTNWSVSCQPVALRAAEISHLLLAHLIALPAQAQIAAVVSKESRPGEPGFDFSKRGYTIFKFIRLNSNDKGQSPNFK